MQCDNVKIFQFSINDLQNLISDQEETVTKNQYCFMKSRLTRNDGKVFSVDELSTISIIIEYARC